MKVMVDSMRAEGASPGDLQGKIQQRIKGMTFPFVLTGENDFHYAGKGIKLGTPNTPIAWYKPHYEKNYHVIYADLTVREVTAAEVPKP